jgi:acetylornithine deacetylase
VKKSPDRPIMPAFEVARDSRIVTALNAAYAKVRNGPQPTGALARRGILRHRCRPSLRRRRDGG